MHFLIEYFCYENSDVRQVIDYSRLQLKNTKTNIIFIAIASDHIVLIVDSPQSLWVKGFI